MSWSSIHAAVASEASADHTRSGVLSSAAARGTAMPRTIPEAIDEAAARREIAPTGRLRVGVVFAPAASPFFVIRKDDGAPEGVTVDLGAALAAELRLPVEFFVVPNSGELTDATEAGAVDLTFMPVDEQRKRRVEFGPAYFLAES